MPDLKARDAKLIQYLNEAYGKEKQLETALSAHIGVTKSTSYKKRLQQHLQETRAHARGVERRIRQLGGRAEAISVPGPEVVSEAAERVQEMAQRGAALARSPLRVVSRTGDRERLLRNAKSEYADEAQEIATYIAIEALAQSVGDRETAKLARSIRRQEERMAGFLARLIPQLTKAVAQAEIPASQRDGGTRRRGATRRRSSGSAAGSKGRAATVRSASRRASTSGRSTARRTTSRRSTGTRRRTTWTASGRRRATGTASARRRTTARGAA